MTRVPPVVEASLVLQFFANGVVFGSVLALAAIGLSLVYGILNLSNFAHGDFVTLGAFLTLLFAVPAGAGGLETGKGLGDHLALAALLVPAVLLATAAVAGLFGLAGPETRRDAARWIAAAAVGALLLGLLALAAAPALSRPLLLAAPALVLLAIAATVRLTRTEAVVLAAYAVALAGLGAYLLLRPPTGAGTTNLRLFVATLLAIGLTIAFVLGLEFLVWRPLRRKRGTVLTLIIVSIGVALVLRNSLQLYFGGGNRFFERPTPISDVILGIQISDAQQFTLVASVGLILLVHLFLKLTRVGKAMRALSDNIDLARVSGIDVDRVILYVWAISGALVAVAGVLLTLVANNNMNVNMGFTILLPLFASVLLGGIGSPYGAIAGGFVVGIGMKTSVLWLGSEYELASAFIILILVMLVRPQGFFGGKA